uniref:Ku domain-containing protein n=1 Tax=Steinernema glaseri TaxID=37863 RepID=A0A1I7Y5V8_9BILA
MEQLQVGGASGKKATIFALDCREAMFEPFEHEGQQSTPFALATNLIWRTMSAIALGGNQNHYVSVIFFNTAKKSKEASAVDNVFNVVEMALLTPTIVNDFKNKYSSYENLKEQIDSEFGFGTANIAELFFRFLRDITYGVGGKLQRNRCVVHLFSTMSDVTDGYPDIARKAAAIRKDLLGNGCRYATYLFGAEEPSDEWREIDPEIDDMEERLYELQLDAKYVTQERTRRAIASLDFQLAEGMSIALGIYGLYTKHATPQGTKLDAETNEPIVTKTAFITKESGKDVAPIEVKMQQPVGGVDVALNKKEVEQFRRLCDPGLVLLGFKPLSSFKLSHCFDGSKFVFPQEKIISGSSTVYKALLEECLEQKKYALVRATVRRNTAPRLAALVPRRGKEGDPTIFEGFHLIDLPFSDDKRDLTAPMTKEDIVDIGPSDNQINLAKGFIKKLTSSYSADSFSNPFLERFYRYIEANALETELPDSEEFNSDSVPWFLNPKTKDRASIECDAFCSALGLTGAAPKASKRTVSSTQGEPKKKKTCNTKEEFIEYAKELHEQKQLGRLTRQELFDGAALIGMVYNKAMKKDTLIERLQQHLQL